MYINFQHFRVSRSVKTVHTNTLQTVASCINLQQPIVIKKIKPISDMHHRAMYIYINFQEIRVIRSVVYTNIFANKRKLRKFAREKTTKNIC